MTRYYRSTAEAFAADRFPAVFGPYRRPTRALRVLVDTVLWLAALALLGAVVYAPDVWGWFAG